MSFKEKTKLILQKNERIFRNVYSIYAFVQYIRNYPREKSYGPIFRISPNDNDHEYFFGYYDKSPWDINDRYVLCLRVKNATRMADSTEQAEIIIIDTEKHEDDKERIKLVATTTAWNVQQGCMLQWLGPDYSSKIIYNDFRNGEYCSIILDINKNLEKVIKFPVYSVSSDGTFALSLDFNRLHNLRPGYGYGNQEEATKGQGLPMAPAIWYIDLVNNQKHELLSYKDFAEFEPRREMCAINAVHKVNHIMISPDNKRFMVLYRWFVSGKKFTRLITCDVTGKNMYLLSDDDMVSHCFWKDSHTILAFENKKVEGYGYYLMKDQSKEYKQCWPELKDDGHPSYSFDSQFVVTDTYPNKSRIQSLKIMSAENCNSQVYVIARFFSPLKYWEEVRCDLHPRWNHAGNIICVDSVFEGRRRLYGVDLTRTNIEIK